jgi:hypothetical protein
MMKSILLSVATGIIVGIVFAVAVAYWDKAPSRMQMAWDPAADHMREYLMERPDVSGQPSQP